MTSEEYQKRLKRARNETFVIARTDSGFRIHSPANGGRVYHVTGNPNEPECSCPDFQHHADDPEWRCKHVLAVLHRKTSGEETPTPAPAEEATTSRLTLKRSVSPDGKIDALSVEVSLPVNGDSAEATESRAREVLALQDAIATGFLKRNGNGSGNRRGQSAQPSTNGEPVPATILSVGGMDGKWGRRLFLTFEVSSSVRARVLLLLLAHTKQPGLMTALAFMGVYLFVFFLAWAIAGLFIVTVFGDFMGAFLTLFVMLFAAPFLFGFLAEQWGPETVAAMPVVGPIYVWIFSPATYYRTDTALMFQKSVHNAVMEVIDELTTSKGMRALSPEDRKPILAGLTHRAA